MAWHNKNFGKSAFDPDFDPDYDPVADLDQYEAERELREQLKRENQ